MSQQQASSKLQRQIQLELIQNMQPIDNFQMDILFSNSYQKYKRGCIFTLTYLAIKDLLIIIFMPIDYSVLFAPKSSLTVFMAIAIANTTLVILTSTIHYLTTINNSKNALQIATQMGHVEKLQSQNQQFVSKNTYDAQHEIRMDAQVVTQQYKSRCEGLMTKLIQSAVKLKSPNFQSLSRFFYLVSFGNFIFGIVALSTSNPNSSQLGVLITYLVLDGFSHLLFIIVITIIALSPLICCLCCVFCCFCKKDGQEVKMPPAVPATIQIINEAGGDCTICFQSFKIQDNVIILPCSKKHAFHEMCIGAWVKVSPSCPICRKIINEQVGI